MISKQTIETAKQAHLPDVLKSLNQQVVRSGADYYLKEHDSLKFFRQNGVWVYKWWSRNGEVGDGIQYLMRYCSMSFQAAVEVLTGQPSTLYPVPIQKPSGKNLQKPYKNQNWQQKSRRLIHFSKASLFGPNGKERLSYLTKQRGLQLNTIRKHRLGWLPAKEHMASKLVIPCYDSHGKLMRIRFRMDDCSQERYRISKGSCPKAPFPINVAPGKPLMILESELDAILVAQEAESHTGVVAMGTTAFKLEGAFSDYLLNQCPVILVSLDNDPSGIQRSAQLIEQFPNAINWPVPVCHGKDPGEAWKTMSLIKWVKAGLKQSRK